MAKEEQVNTYVTCNGILVNNHTGYMSKVGISFAQVNYATTLNSLIFIITFIS